MLAGHVKGHKTSLSSMFEAVGAYAAGNMSEEDVKEFKKKGFLWIKHTYLTKAVDTAVRSCGKTSFCF